MICEGAEMSRRTVTTIPIPSIYRIVLRKIKKDAVA